MYSECSDFFYVWMKRSLGRTFPDLFSAESTDKDAEAVANFTRFRSEKRGVARELSERDYEAKMQACFQESHRILRSEGVLTIMFTHKRVEAWDTLAAALLNAGFEITASWPIHTESEHSLHQARKNAASSTILLVCRKRLTNEEGWWEDLKPELDKKVTDRADYFSKQGIPNQDTFIACFGPALQVISQKWPVKKKDGSVIRPNEALDRAREVLKNYRFEHLARGQAKLLDPVSQFFVLAWDTFQAREFPFDEARRLAIATGVDVEKLKSQGLLEKKGEFVVLLTPEERFRRGFLKATERSHSNDIDYVQAALYAYSTGKSSDLKLFHERTDALKREGYRAALEVLAEPGLLPPVQEVSEYRVLAEMLEANPELGIQIRRITTSAGLPVRQTLVTGYDGDEEKREASDDQTD